MIDYCVERCNLLVLGETFSTHRLSAQAAICFG